MEVKLYVGNLSTSTTGKQINILFGQAGDVIAVDLITDRLTGDSKGYAYVTMSAQSEADRAVSMFNACFLDDHLLRVALVKPRVQRVFARTY
jgi:RNA recognition motif-containing protein